MNMKYGNEEEFENLTNEVFFTKPEGGLSLDSRSADKEQKPVPPEKSKAYVTTFAKKVGAQIPDTQNQKWSYFPEISQID